MVRLTRVKDQYPCRISGGCLAEEWIESLGYDLDKMEGDICSDCPFEQYINRLAEYEDAIEKFEKIVPNAHKYVTNLKGDM